MRLRRRAALIALPLVSLLLACVSGDEGGPSGGGEPGAGGKADGQSEPAVLELTADRGPVLTGDLVAGAPLVLRYDLARATECRGQTGGSDVWGVTGFYSVDGDEAAEVALTELVDGVTTPIDARIVVPAGSDLALWFRTSNRWGCVAYDSDFGANFHLAIGEAPAPASAVTLEFAADGEPTQSGPLAGGSDVVVRYDLARLSACRGTSRGYPQWSITGFYAVDDDAPRAFEVSRAEGDDRVAQDATIEVRAGRSLALWFQNVNRWGCVAWDSRYGANYVFPLSR